MNLRASQRETQSRKPLPFLHLIGRPIAMLSLLFVTGCSTAIYESGRYSDVLKRGSSQMQIRGQIGEPVLSGALATNKFPEWGSRNTHFDEFIIKGPVYEEWRSDTAGMSGAMTLGFSELIAFPQAIWWKLTNRGWKRVTVLYSTNSNYISHIVIDAKQVTPDPNYSATRAESE